MQNPHPIRERPKGKRVLNLVGVNFLRSWIHSKRHPQQDSLQDSVQIRAVIFDLDNTLLNFIKMKEDGSKAAVKAMVEAGLPMTEKEASEELIRAYMEYGVDENVAFSRFLQEKMGIVDERILQAAIGAYLKEKETHLHAYPKARRTIKRIKARRIRVALVTDAVREKAEPRIRAIGLYDLFDEIVYSDDKGVKDKKAEFTPFIEALKRLKLRFRNALVVDDSPPNLGSAKKLGMITALPKYGIDPNWPWKNPDGVKADYELESIADILPIIDNRNPK